MTWTTTPPDKPGFYWVEDRTGYRLVVEVVWDQFRVEHLDVLHPGSDVDTPIEAMTVCRWSGAIPEPEEVP